MRGEEGDDVGFGEVEAQGFQRDFELVVVDVIIFVEVEELELWWMYSLAYCLDALVVRSGFAVCSRPR